MISFIKNYNLSNLREKLLLLYIVNIADLIFSSTMYGISTFKKANSLESAAIYLFFIIIAIRIVVPGILLYFCNYRIQEANQNQLKKANLLISLAFITLIILSNVNSLSSLL